MGLNPNPCTAVDHQLVDPLPACRFRNPARTGLQVCVIDKKKHLRSIGCPTLWLLDRVNRHPMHKR